MAIYQTKNQSVTPVAGEPVLISFNLSSTYTILSGTLLDSVTSTAIQNAPVKLMVDIGTTGTYTDLHYGITDSAGCFLFSFEPDAANAYKVVAAGYTP